MKNKIVEAFMKLRQTLLDSTVHYRDLYKVIIVMTPKAFCELRAEEPFIECNKKVECYYVELHGNKIPIVIDYQLPENVEFQIMHQKDYERIEKEKLLDKFYELFNK
jgi:hypothetical protein